MRKLFFQQSSSRSFHFVSNFFLRIYICRHFATNAKNFPSDRLRSFCRFLFFPLFSPFSLFSFLIFRLCACVCVYVCECKTGAECSIKKSNSNFSLVHLASTTKICRTRRIEKIGMNKFFEDHRVADKKIRRFESSNAYVENQFR